MKIMSWLLLVMLLAGCSGSSGGSPDSSGSSSLGGDEPPAPSDNNGSDRIWQPAPGTSWQWQLSGLPVDLTSSVDVYDIDLFDNDASVVAGIHAEGGVAVCYLSAGSWEDWRPDSGAFPAELIGNNYEGWAGEKWLDIRAVEQLSPVLGARLDLCKAKGFDAVEPDNIDGYTNDTGFPLTADDQLVFNKWLAAEAHRRGLSIGLKNDPDQAVLLEPFFDWALTEDCFVQGWCSDMLSFIDAGKAVFAAEYIDTGTSLAVFCPQAEALGFDAILKDRELSAELARCPE